MQVQEELKNFFLKTELPTSASPVLTTDPSEKKAMR